MPLSDEAPALIRINLEQLQKGARARLVVIGNLTVAQLAAINDNRRARGHPPIVDEVVFIGRHIYESRIVRDGYSVEDVLDQIESAMDAAADRYGNAVQDRAIFECSARHPRPELFSVVPKGDHRKTKRPLTE